MAVVHVKKRDNPYVQIDKRVFEDPRLSWRAKGIMGYLLSKPNGWKVNVIDIWGKGKEGRNAVQDCMAELKLHGYADLVTTHDENGVFTGKEWVVSEEPKNGFTDVTEKPKTDAPINRKSGFRSISNNDINSNNEEGEVKEKKQTPPPADFDSFMSEVERLSVEAKKEKGINPVAPPPSFAPDCPACHGRGNNTSGGHCWECSGTGEAPTHILKTTDTETLPGALITDVQGMNLEPTNPNATTALFNRMNLTPKATNGDEADAILTKWAAENIETVKLKYSRAKRKFTPEDLDRLIVKFCGQYASNKDTGTRERFLYDPARFFNDKLSAWLADQPGFEKMLEPKNGFTQPEPKSNLPKSIRRY
jgi:hypothetical protein